MQDDPVPDNAGPHQALEEDLVDRLTPAEQASLSAGIDMWHTAPMVSIGLGSMRCSDGPHGVRGSNDPDGPTAAAFPVATALAATWNVELVGDIGSALAVEAGDKGASVLLAPTLNLHRHPLAGRNFECFSEDPYLTARMGVAIITGVQDGGVAATAKHFVANDAEFDRHQVSSEVSIRALRELYLVPFEAAVTQAGVWAVMTAYNRLNGVHCAAHHWLLEDLLRAEWGFDGLVMSDWYGTYSTVGPALAGLDLEMPGPALYQGSALWARAQAGDVPYGVVREKAVRVVRLARRVGALAAGPRPTSAPTPTPPPAPTPARSVSRPEMVALARRAAVESMVLLSNHGVLPLAPDGFGRVAIIGPNADPGQIMGGGSSAVRPHTQSSPRQALEARFGGKLGPDGEPVEVRFEPGCRTHRLCPPLIEAASAGAGPLSFAVRLYGGLEPAGEPAWVGQADDVTVAGVPFHAAGVDPGACAVTWTGRYVPAVSGVHEVGVTAIGRSRVLIEGEVVADNWSNPRPGHTFYANGTEEVRAAVALTAGQPVQLEIHYQRHGGLFPAIRIGMEAPESEHLLDRALGLARGADLVILVVGSNEEWESEGHDRHGLDLPGAQPRLIDAVLSVNRNTVVVLNTGSPTSLGWADRAAAVVQAWYPGMAFGDALADILFGDVNPSGRLPTTFPRRLEDHPAYLHYPPEAGRMTYGEGIFAGYRGFDAIGTDPLYPFGFGLSYTTFAFGPLRVEHQGAPGTGVVRVVLDVTNVGERPGAEVVQLYVGDDEASVARPPKELKGFAKVFLQPGETHRVHIDLDERAFSFWDPAMGGWRLEPGRFSLLAGASSRDIRARAAVIW
ncbi:MAG: glycoside hydrolase family 3 C-terminal domain-containing protein [Acidimicrobiales bacterium]